MNDERLPTYRSYPERRYILFSFVTYLSTYTQFYLSPLHVPRHAKYPHVLFFVSSPTYSGVCHPFFGAYMHRCTFRSI